MIRVVCLLVLCAQFISATPFSPSPYLDFQATASSITDQCQAAKARADAALEAVASLPDSARTFANTPQAIEEALDELNDETSGDAFLRDVAVSSGVRQAAADCYADLNDFGAYTGQWRGGEVFTREPLFKAVKSYAAQGEALNGVQRKLLERELLDFKRNGMLLSGSKRALLASLRRRIIELQEQFDRNLAAANGSLLLSRQELEGLPDDYIRRLPKEGGKYRVSLDYPDYFPFMENAKDPAARQKLEFLFDNRAADKNVEILKEALKDRDAAAHLLGYPDHAGYILEERMAPSPRVVEKFLSRLEKKLKPMARKELAVLLKLKSQEEGKSSDGIIHAWDWRYYDNVLHKARYQVDEEKIKEYFPLDTVTQGLFAVYEDLLGVKFKPIANAAVWHPEVKLYEISDAQSGQTLGYFYMDLFPREGKYKHAESNDILDGRDLSDGTYQKPVSAIVANFSKPSPGHPSLLTHDEVQTYFHEFGHIMHQTLTRAPYERFSGSNVAMDFVEAPSQMLENWVWDPEVLSRLSGYYKDSSQKLPPQLAQKMIAARYVDAGLENLRQVFFARLDMEYHTDSREFERLIEDGGAFVDRDVADPTAVYQELQGKISLIPMTPGTNPEASFGHLMDGYDAGYYGYLWSKVYAQDMFTRFESDGLLNPAIGWLYRKDILEPGGSRDEIDSVRAFLGREPNDKAFLKSIGLGQKGV